MSGLIVLIASTAASGHEADRPRYLVAPFAGWDRNELTVGGMGPPTVTTDTAPEYGLFAMMMHPRVVVNNTVFWTDPNDAEILGNMFFVNVYGPPEQPWTWNVGGGWTWHEIETAGPTISVSVPMLKAGAVWRPKRGLSLNLYLAHTWESVDTDNSESSYNSILYGVTLKWRWRMIQATLKYYLEDNMDLDETFNTLRARMMFAFNESTALFLRAEHMEHSVTTDDAVVFGVAFVF